MNLHFFTEFFSVGTGFLYGKNPIQIENRLVFARFQLRLRNKGHGSKKRRRTKHDRFLDDNKQMQSPMQTLLSECGREQGWRADNRRSAGADRRDCESRIQDHDLQRRRGADAGRNPFSGPALQSGTGRLKKNMSVVRGPGGSRVFFAMPHRGVPDQNFQKWVQSWWNCFFS